MTPREFAPSCWVSSGAVREASSSELICCSSFSNKNQQMQIRALGVIEPSVGDAL